MTLCQLMTLADEHQAAHQTGGNRSQPEQSGLGPLEMVAMQRG
nr:hypothetical protein [Streptomyces sp. LUP30]